MNQRTPCIHGVHLYPSKPLVHPLSKLSDKCYFTLLIPNLFFFFVLWHQCDEFFRSVDAIRGIKVNF